MTTEEKLDRLTERVDAIAQSVELLTTLHRDLEESTAAKFAETNAKFAETNAKFAETNAKFAETAGRFTETLGFINRLAHVAETHEQRLDDLEHPN
jgi:chromosome segregation ATPase